jgi:hypothetical protein
MTTYKGIKGYNIPSVSSDPSNLQTGQVWYNTTSNVIKAYGASVPAGAWASGTACNTGRAYFAAAGIATAGLIFGGNNPGDPTGPALDFTETWNGSTWTEVGDLPVSIGYQFGLGTNTAAISGGGPPPTTTVNQWNGTSWTAINSLATSCTLAAGAGTTTAGIKFGGEGPGYLADTETYDGTSWTEVANLNTARKQGAAATKGTTTATMYSGGEPRTVNSETWDGTSWTEGNNMILARAALAGSGITTSAMGFGGNPPVPPAQNVQTEVYNGTSWSEVADLATPVNQAQGIGASGTATLNCCGTTSPPVYSNAVEEWTAGDATQTFTAS